MKGSRRSMKGSVAYRRRELAEARCLGVVRSVSPRTPSQHASLGGLYELVC